MMARCLHGPLDQGGDVVVLVRIGSLKRHAVIMAAQRSCELAEADESDSSPGEGEKAFRHALVAPLPAPDTAHMVGSTVHL